MPTPGHLLRHPPRFLRAALVMLAALVAGAVVGLPCARSDECGPAYGSFGGAHRPPACWRPYSPSSAFNRTIPADPPLNPHSDSIVRRLMDFGPIANLAAGQAGTPGDYGRPLYFSNSSDPSYRIHCTERWGRCPLEGLRIHVPAGARPAGGTDAHLTLIDQSSGIEYDLWQAQPPPPGGGTLQASWGGRLRIDGDGRGSGAVAAGYGTAAGLIRAEELAAGHIDHALFLAVGCDSGHHVYPAIKGGARCEDPTAAPAMGTRFQLAMSDAQIDALAVPPWKKTILHAMAHYGMIAGDTGGGAWGLATESGVAYTSLGQPDQWVALARQLSLPYYAPDADYVFTLAPGVDYGRYLRVVDPCVSSGHCSAAAGAARHRRRGR